MLNFWTSGFTNCRESIGELQHEVLDDFLVGILVGVVLIIRRRGEPENVNGHSVVPIPHLVSKTSVLALG